MTHHPQTVLRTVALAPAAATVLAPATGRTARGLGAPIAGAACGR